MNAVQTEHTADTGGSQNIGWMFSTDLADWRDCENVPLRCGSNFTNPALISVNGAEPATESIS